MAKLERDYQAGLIKRILAMFPGSIALKNDSSYIQGIPDWTIFYGPYWATLEAKRKEPGPSDYQPNQEYYITLMNSMSFSSCVYPENEEEVLNALAQTFRFGRETRYAESQPTRLDSVRRRQDREDLQNAAGRGERYASSRTRGNAYSRGRKAS